MHRDTGGLAGRTFDVVVIGAGIHGAWLALRAARYGYRVALLEKHDFGAATSANSLKILHGGFRYLQRLDLGRMRRSIQARRELMSTVPGLVRPLPCLLPLGLGGLRSPWVLGPALAANDAIGWDRNRGLSPELRLPFGRLVGGSACRASIEPLAVVDAIAGACWWDATVTETGRLTIDPVLRAAALGATVANRVEAGSLRLARGRVRGVNAVDRVTGSHLEIDAAVVVDATGPWAGTLSASAGLPTAFLPPGWTGGINLVLRRSLGLETAVALSSKRRRTSGSGSSTARREFFFVPWRGVTMVGTEYCPVAGVAQAEEGPPRDVVRAFLGTLSEIAPRARISESDIGLIHWGLLPLMHAGDELPRSTPIVAAGRAETGAEGLVVVIAEKLTSAPVLSIRVLREIARLQPRRERPRRGLERRVDRIDRRDGDVDPCVARRLAARYGEDWRAVAAHGSGRPELLGRVHPSVDTLGVEVCHAVREEMALSLDDLVLRRLGLGDAGDPGHDVMRRCAEIAAPYWSHDGPAIDSSVAALEARFADYRLD